MSSDLIVNFPFASRHPDLWRLITENIPQSIRALRGNPPGTFPPNILKYDVSSVPVLQLGLGSSTMSESQLFDYGNAFIRTQLATIQGATIPNPYGGKFRTILADLDPDAMYAKQVSASDVSNAMALQNLILPAGNAKFGDRDYQVKPGRVNQMIVQLVDRLSPGSVIVLEAGENLDRTILPNFESWDIRRYGDTRIAIKVVAAAGPAGEPEAAERSGDDGDE